MADLAFDLFSGAGGASLGLKRAGLYVVGFERDADSCATHEAAGFPTVRVDLSTYEWPDVIGTVKVLHGSPPCQPFSEAGDGDGEFDDRDGMPWMLAAIDAIRAPLVTVENVPGLANRVHRPYLMNFIRQIEALGYHVEYKVLNAADVGVPQVRKRLIIVARNDGKPIRWPTPTHTDGGGLFTLPWVTMAEALGWEDGAIGFPRRSDATEDAPRGVRVVDGVEYRDRDFFDTTEPSPTITEKGRSWTRWRLNTGTDWKAGGTRDDAQTKTLDGPPPTVSGESLTQWQLRPGRHPSPGDPEGNRRGWPVDGPVPTVAFGHDVAAWGWERPATTIATEPRVFQPGGHVANDGRDNSKMKRRSEGTLRVEVDELAVLQGFPADFPFQGTRTSQARQVGNALPPALLHAVIAVNR